MGYLKLWQEECLCSWREWWWWWGWGWFQDLRDWLAGWPPKIHAKYTEPETISSDIYHHNIVIRTLLEPLIKKTVQKSDKKISIHTKNFKPVLRHGRYLFVDQKWNIWSWAGAVHYVRIMNTIIRDILIASIFSQYKLGCHFGSFKLTLNKIFHSAHQSKEEILRETISDHMVHVDIYTVWQPELSILSIMELVYYNQTVLVSCLIACHCSLFIICREPKLVLVSLIDTHQLVC